jgi:hypothetical protein
MAFWAMSIQAEYIWRTLHTSDTELEGEEREDLEAFSTSWCAETVTCWDSSLV